MNNLNIRIRTAPRYLARKLTRVPGRRCVVPIPIRTPPEAGCWDRTKTRRACLPPSARMQPLVLDLTRMRASNSCSSDLDSAPLRDYTRYKQKRAFLRWGGQRASSILDLHSPSSAPAANCGFTVRAPAPAPASASAPPRLIEQRDQRAQGLPPSSYVSASQGH
jgi:hypothetical protein